MIVQYYIVNAFSFLFPYLPIFASSMLTLNYEISFISGNLAEGTDAPGLATLQERIAEAEENLKVCTCM